MIKIRFLLIFMSIFVLECFAMPEKPVPTPDKKRANKYVYTYVERTHTKKEILTHVSAIYAASWAVYPLTQPETFLKEGSFKKYRHNFGRLVFDKDEPFWNWMIHPLSGSQLYLFYRANGYTRLDSMTLGFLSSALFEFTIEIYTEPASIQDLYQTPVIGSLFGVGIETLSMYLLNTGNPVGKFFGHLINPATLFWFYEGKISLTPHYDGKVTGLRFSYEF